MAYSAQTFTEFETPDVDKWNTLWSNDADFNSRINDLVVGWVDAASTEDWSYASETTIYVSGDVTGTYQVGDKIKITQPTDGDKYYYIHTVSSHDVGNDRTTLTIATNTEYGNIDNEAITSPQFSRADRPYGFPEYLTFNSVLSGVSSTLSNLMNYRVIHGHCHIRFRLSGVSNSTNFTATVPFTKEDDGNPVNGGGLVVHDNSTDQSTQGGYTLNSDASTLSLFKNWANTWTASNNKYSYGELSYPIKV